MQTLYFEEAWDRTIAEKDREKIIALFHEIKQQTDVSCSFLWKATNHKNETLITVLIHNPKPTPLELNSTVITYSGPSGIRLTSQFDLPFHVPATTSVPWTFIFSPENETQQQPHFIINQ